MTCAGLVCLQQNPSYVTAGRLFNALQQHTAHQLGVPLDSLQLMTAWNKSTLQVSWSDKAPIESFSLVRDLTGSRHSLWTSLSPLCTLQLAVPFITAEHGYWFAECTVPDAERHLSARRYV